MFKKLVTLSLLTLCATVVFAQQGMNNESVIKMVKAGLSDDIIVSTINASPGTYDTSADALIALKKAGVSERIIALIVSKGAGAAAAPATAQAQQSASSQQEPEVMGKIFFLDPNTQALKQLPGEPWKRKNKAGFASIKVVDEVAGEHSSFRISAKDKVVFVFKPFPDQQTSNILERIRIYVFDVESGKRVSVVETAKGRTRQGNLNAVSVQPVKYGASSFALNPPDFHLSPGEYWILLPGAAGFNDPLITFGVD